MKVESTNEISSNDLKFSTTQILRGLCKIFDCQEIIVLTGKMNEKEKLLDAGVYSYCSEKEMMIRLMQAATHIYISQIKEK